MEIQFDLIAIVYAITPTLIFGAPSEIGKAIFHYDITSDKDIHDDITAALAA